MDTMESRRFYKVVATAPDGRHRVYTYDNLIAAVGLKLNIETARGWYAMLYLKIGNNDWIEL